MKILKKGLLVLLLILLTVFAAGYLLLRASLPALDGEQAAPTLLAQAQIERDSLGTAVVYAENRQDAAYALGFAHGQDRFFQMDLQRRNAAGELSFLFGEKALELDKANRFHQLRKRSKAIVAGLSATDLALLDAYTEGVNAALEAQTMPSFEYLLSGNTPTLWLPEDSILTIFSMYLDLQGATLERDLTLTILNNQFGQDMVDFITQPSQYQAALDDSRLARRQAPIPDLPPTTTMADVHPIDDLAEPGSNNWAVTGQLTASGHAMLSDDMHLSLRVPVIWYRAQLNYTEHEQDFQVTGVSLPGVPAIVVGSNNHLAWGFTNAYLDTADWVKLNADEPTWQETEIFQMAETRQTMALTLSRFGPVREIDGQRYALNWVAYQDYAVNLSLLKLEQATTVEQALALAPTMGIPLQNLLAADEQGNAGWRPAGAFPTRPLAASTAVPQAWVDMSQWQQSDLTTPLVLNPDNHRLWTANSRVISSSDLPRYGDGAYALGARAAQIRQRLFEKDQFAESDFYQIQLDNQAQFLQAWQRLLVTTLTQQGGEFRDDLDYLQQWGECACTESVGYTLVKAFRNRLIDKLFAPLEQELTKRDRSLRTLTRYLEPALWQLLKQQPASWLQAENSDWSTLLVSAYNEAKAELLSNFSDKNDLADLRWGKVNALQLTHPFSQQIPLLGSLLNMPSAEAWGDTYMPAVQGKNFGASQRLLVQPGLEQQAILTVPGGQSGHPLSEYYRSGFADYVDARNTPLLPKQTEHRLILQPGS